MPLITLAVCDDVRWELGKKLTLVGFYGRTIQVASVPITLPKLCIFAQFDPEPYERVSLRLIAPGDVLIMEVLDQPAPECPKTEIPMEFVQTHLVFYVAPMVFSATGTYRVEYSFQRGPTYKSSFYVGLDPSLGIGTVPPAV